MFMLDLPLSRQGQEEGPPDFSPKQMALNVVTEKIYRLCMLVQWDHDSKEVGTSPHLYKMLSWIVKAKIMQD